LSCNKEISRKNCNGTYPADNFKNHVFILPNLKYIYNNWSCFLSTSNNVSLYQILDVLTTTKFIVDNPKKVQIDMGAVKRFASEITPEDLKKTDISFAKPRWSVDELIQLTFVFNSVIYCLWANKGEEKWKVDFDGELLDGSIALFKCFEGELERNPAFLTGKYLVSLTADQLGEILKGNVVIPLFKERLVCLNEVGQVLNSRYGGSFLNLFEQADGDAKKLAELVIENFPSFDDSSLYNGQKIGFYKRAQLNSKMISDVIVSKGGRELKSLDKLTAFADYKIPQILRRFGVLVYTQDLAEKVDSYQLIDKDTEEELEIRANTVWAVEYVQHEVQKTYQFFTAPHVDNLLWNKSQRKVTGEKPYHRTLTIAY